MPPAPGKRKRTAAHRPVGAHDELRGAAAGLCRVRRRLLSRLYGRFIFALYLIGIVLAVLSGLLFKRVLFHNKPPAPFVMELPPYRIPSLRSVLTHMWERSPPLCDAPAPSSSAPPWCCGCS